jgi:hypothetical protein
VGRVATRPLAKLADRVPVSALAPLQLIDRLSVAPGVTATLRQSL